jgi:hypothetical protein|tara:strand:+ start:5560 stop:5688 length:129 start_codon:yes stop_codon:yes gene_type:complete
MRIIKNDDKMNVGNSGNATSAIHGRDALATPMKLKSKETALH